MNPEAEFIALSTGLAARGVPMLSAMLLTASHLGVAQDSRSFARILGVEHALVLRELVAMANETGLVGITRRDARSQRLHFTLTEAAQALLLHALADQAHKDQNPEDQDLPDQPAGPAIAQ